MAAAAGAALLPYLEAELARDGLLFLKKSYWADKANKAIENRVIIPAYKKTRSYIKSKFPKSRNLMKRSGPRYAPSAKRRRAVGPRPSSSSRQMSIRRPTRQYITNAALVELDAHKLNIENINFPARSFGIDSRATQNIHLSAIRFQATIGSLNVGFDWRVHVAICQQRYVGDADGVDFFDDPNIDGPSADFQTAQLVFRDFNEMYGKINPRKYNVLKHQHHDLQKADSSGLQDLSQRQWNLDWYLPVNKRLSFTGTGVAETVPEYPFRVFVWATPIGVTSAALINAPNVINIETRETVYYNNVFDQY